MNDTSTPITDRCKKGWDRTPQGNWVYASDMAVLELRLIAAQQALKLALPCVEYTEITAAAEGLDAIHGKCLTALDSIRPCLLPVQITPS